MDAALPERALPQVLILVALFLLALLPRLYSAQTQGWGWDGPGSFTLVNFDEAGSCRAALDGFSYSSLVGWQTISIASVLGMPPPEGVRGKPELVKAYCHSAGHIMVARSWSAVLGALTVVALAVLCLQLLPSQPAVAWTAASLLAVSGFHISQSHSGTVDAASTFFIYLFLAALATSLRRGRALGLVLCLPLLAFAVWAKYWVFAFTAALAVLPVKAWQVLGGGCGPGRFLAPVLVLCVWLATVCNTAYQPWGIGWLLVAYYLLLPWRRLGRGAALLWAALPLLLWCFAQLEPVQAYTAGSLHSRFGAGYGAIAENKWLRNLLNLPLLLVLALGIPASLFIPAGVRAMLADRDNARVWLCLLPVLVFLLYMAFLAPVTYYRHYLPLVPAAALFAAMGLYATRWARRPWFLVPFLLWPALLAWDMVSDYHRDPRQALRAWFAGHPGARVFHTYYVNPPAGSGAVLFRPEYAAGAAQPLRRGEYLLLSENWYDTAYSNELNGPLVANLERLVKTRPEYASFYRQAIAGQHPYLAPEHTWRLQHFMPELLLHRAFYGNFQLFVGDIILLRVRE